MPPRSYRSPEEDNARWAALRPRDGDIVVSTRSKHGTTWVQTILLLLVHGLDLPAPLASLSPWLDHAIEPVDTVVARLDAQAHRRIIKTHTPLDGLPLHEGTTYVVAARHPLDAAVSLYHQGDNFDRERIRELVGDIAHRPSSRPDLRTWLHNWVNDNPHPTKSLDSLPGVLHHLTDAWGRRGDRVILVHYADLLADLDGQMRSLAALLGIEVRAGWADLVAAATFEEMRSKADFLAPDPVGVFKDRRAFFREGRSGAGAEALTPSDLTAYHQHAAALAPPDVLDWLHR